MSDEITINKTKLAEHLAESELEQQVTDNYILAYNRKPKQDEIFSELFTQDENFDLEGNPCIVYKKEYNILYNQLVDEFIELIQNFKI